MFKNPLFLFLLFVLFFFQMILLSYVPIFSYLDEAITIWALLQVVKYPISGIHKSMLILICILTLLGVICNFQYNIQTGLSPILNDIGNCFKVFVTYIGTCCYYKYNMQRDSLEALSRKIMLFLKVLIPIMFICCVINLFVDIGMRHEFRHGLYSFRFIFGGGGDLSMLYYSIVLIYLISRFFSQSKMTLANKLFLFMMLTVWLSTLRSRAFLFVVFFVLIYYLIIVKNVRIKVNLISILASVLLFILICADQVSVYMDNEGSARFNLLMVGIDLMKSHFPFGVGFGTYGTDVAAKYYSPIYYQYGLDYVWGLSPDDPQFAHDNYWPAIMGQFGFVGILGFGALIFLLFKDIYLSAGDNKYLKVAAMFICFTQIVASLATAVFFHFVTVALMFFTAMVFTVSKKYSN